jgi:tetratricopeptide (TPR) repeat protein
MKEPEENRQDQEVARRISQLDRLVDQEQEASDDDSRARLADALYEKAVLLEVRGDLAEALSAYRDIVGRFRDSKQERIRAARAGAQSDAAFVATKLGTRLDARETAESVIQGYLDRPPAGVVDKIADSAFMLAEILEQEGDLESSVALLRRVLKAVDPDVSPTETRIAAEAHFALGRVARDRGMLDECHIEFDKVVALFEDHTSDNANQLLADPDDDRGRLALAETLSAQAYVYFHVGQSEAGRARCELLIEMLDDDSDPFVQDHVSWASEHVGFGRRKRLRRSWPTRRGRS